jgi:hypothetical protein
MAVMARESGTDEGLGALRKDMDHRFDKVDQRFAAVDQRFEVVDQRFNAVEARMAEGFTRLDADIRELRRMMFYGFIALMTVMVSGFAAQITL